ncbi:MAG: hypothetical protein ACI9QL_000146 [Candidatus Omnitrophota bacterium]|jgi:hypothetical protein
MSTEEHDQQLRASIQQAEQGSATPPPFAALVDPAASPKRWAIRYEVLGLYLALFITAGIFLQPGPPQADATLAEAAKILKTYDDILAVERAAYAWSTWTSPTDTLLDTHHITAHLN